MKLLYVASTHPLQCADMCLMWQHLGLEWFTTAFYTNTDKPGDLPYISRSLNANESYANEFAKCKGLNNDPEVLLRKSRDYTGTVCNHTFRFSRRFLNMFDTIIFTHVIENLENNIGSLGFNRQKIIFTTFAMQTSLTESKLGQYRNKYGLTLVRNSPIEYIKYGVNYSGHDAIIRGSVVKDEHEVSGWTGEKQQVVTFSNNFSYDEYASVVRLKHYKAITSQITYPSLLFGGGDTKTKYVSHEEKLQLLRKSRVSLVTGTPGSGNTYSLVESLVMGIPIVCFGKQLWQSGDAYEPEILIKHGENGFIANTADEAVYYINRLMADYELAKSIGAAGRKTGIELYGRDNLGKQWKELLNV